MNPIRWIAEAFEDHRGGTSFTRLCTAAIVADVLTVWTLTSLRSGGMVPLDPTFAAVLLSAVGIQAAKSVMERPST